MPGEFIHNIRESAVVDDYEETKDEQELSKRGREILKLLKKQRFIPVHADIMEEIATSDLPYNDRLFFARAILDRSPIGVCDNIDAFELVAEDAVRVVEQAFDILIKAHYLREVLDLSEETGVKLSDTIIQKIYFTVLTSKLGLGSRDMSVFGGMPPAALPEYSEVREIVGAPASSEVVQRAYARSLNYPAHLEFIEQETGIAPDWKFLSEFVFTHDIRKFLASDREELKNISWRASLEELQTLEPPTESTENDPWTDELEPLFADALEEGIVSFESEDDGKLVLEFVRTFGMHNMVSWFDIFVDLKKNEDFSAIKSANRELLEESLGKEVVRSLKNTDEALLLLADFKTNFKEALLRDEVPESYDSVLGLELLEAVKGVTKWERDDRLYELVDQWKETLAKNPELQRLLEGYRERALELPVASGELSPDEEREKDDKIRKILRPAYVENEYRILREALDLGVNINLVEWLEGELAELTSRTREDHPDFAEELSKLLIPSGEDESKIVKFMEELALLTRRKDAVAPFDLNHILRVVSAYHISKVIPEGWRDSMLEISQFRGTLTSRQIENAANWLSQYMREHYFHEDQANHDRTAHSPFSEDLKKQLLSLWGMSGNLEDNTLVAAQRKLQEIEAKYKREVKNIRGKDKKTQVTFVPNRGILRILTGDIGDTCLTARHTDLAKGDCPTITSITMVTNRGEARERLSGSVLFIETYAASGESVLIVRANNPRENLLSEVDSGALIQGILDYAIDIAKTRGIDMVVAPIDQAGMSCSNREKVARYYYNKFAMSPRIELANAPETNFNNYPIWDSESKSACGLIWKRGDIK